MKSIETKASFLLLILSLPCAMSVASCQEPAAYQAKLVVAVVGDGVPPIDLSAPRRIPLNRSQGHAMFRGVQSALARSPRLRGVAHLIRIEGYDDVADAERATQIARRLRKERQVLAVIGHATSESTGAAVGIYDSVGLSILMPIATSPTVMFHLADGRPSDKRFRNAFRLPPADDRAQAPAIAYLLQRLRSRRIALIQDVTQGAVGYSTPLVESLRPLIPSASITYNGFANRLIPNFIEISSSIQSNNPDTVVFCGYGSTAIELMKALREEYKDSLYRPRVVLTDGCLVPELDTSDFQVFVTFPHAKLRPPVSPDDREDMRIVTEIFGNKDNLGYDAFGYDAMIILGQAIRYCLPRGVSRHCIRDALSRPQGFIGTLGTYDFENGENTRSSYDILWGSPLNSTAFTPKKRENVDVATLDAVRGALR